LGLTDPFAEGVGPTRDLHGCAGDGADGTPEQGAVSMDFPMISEPVLLGTNLGAIGNTNTTVDISGKTEITFTFNKPVTVVNDPVLLKLLSISNLYSNGVLYRF